MEKKKNPVGWFEIPVLNMDRAIRFYQNVFNIMLQKNQFGEEEMAWFPFDENENGCSGALVKHEDFYQPSHQGVLIYFTSYSGNLNNELSHVEPEGGKILIHKKLISEDIGYMALFMDTEGNRVAIHSRN